MTNWISVDDHLGDLETDKITCLTLGEEGHTFEVVRVGSVNIYPDNAEQADAVAAAMTDAARRIRARNQAKTLASLDCVVDR